MALRTWLDLCEKEASLPTVTVEEAAGSQAIRIYSAKLQDYLWVAANDRIAQELKVEGITEAIYLPEEVKQLKAENMPIEALQGVHRTKAIFDGSKIIGVKKETKDEKWV